MTNTVTTARLATMLVLFCNGLLYATWGVSLPLIKIKYQLSEGYLSLAMVAVAIGGIVTMRAAGRWIAYTGSGKASIQSGLLMAVTAIPILLIPNYFALLVLLFVYGGLTAANDVAANAQVAHLEKLSGRSLIGSVHGSFSAGGLFGALIAGAWSASSLPTAIIFPLLSLIVSIALFCSSRYLMNEPTSELSIHATFDNTVTQNIVPHDLVQRRLMLFGVLAFSALVIEGAFYDWAAVYMKEISRSPDSWIGFGYAAFAVAMAFGRLCGDAIRNKYRHQLVIACGCLISVSGMSIVLLNASPISVIAGFFISGLGISNIIPLLFSSAGKLSALAGWSASQGLAITTRIAYMGLLIGPLLIGPIAEVVGLRLSLVTLVIVVIGTCSGWLLLSRLTSGTPWILSHETKHFLPINKKISE